MGNSFYEVLHPWAYVSVFLTSFSLARGCFCAQGLLLFPCWSVFAFEEELASCIGAEGVPLLLFLFVISNILTPSMLFPLSKSECNILPGFHGQEFSMAFEKSQQVTGSPRAMTQWSTLQSPLFSCLRVQRAVATACQPEVSFTHCPAMLNLGTTSLVHNSTPNHLARGHCLTFQGRSYAEISLHISVNDNPSSTSSPLQLLCFSHIPQQTQP